ncbi:uncharacterized protein LOC141903294 [Tubulanus polymorphus]|uniref:uncharacterized protein LOC141903294 n=1 Tax=Tubulanus polymorphus TaxID=672921 RepID=UPI003DA58678
MRKCNGRDDDSLRDDASSIVNNYINTDRSEADNQRQTDIAPRTMFISNGETGNHDDHCSESESFAHAKTSFIGPDSITVLINAKNTAAAHKPDRSSTESSSTGNHDDHDECYEQSALLQHRQRQRVDSVRSSEFESDGIVEYLYNGRRSTATTTFSVQSNIRVKKRSKSAATFNENTMNYRLRRTSSAVNADERLLKRRDKTVNLYFLDNAGKVSPAGKSNISYDCDEGFLSTCDRVSPYRTRAPPGAGDMHRITHQLADMSLYYATERKHQTPTRGRPSTTTTDRQTETENPEKTGKTETKNSEILKRQETEVKTAPKQPELKRSRPWTTGRTTCAKERSLSNKLLNVVSIDDSPLRYSFDPYANIHSVVNSRVTTTTDDDSQTDASLVSSARTESGIYDMRIPADDDDETAGQTSEMRKDELYTLLFDEDMVITNRAVDRGFGCLLKPSRNNPVIDGACYRGLYRYDNSRRHKLRPTRGSRHFQRMLATLRLQLLMGENSPTRERFVKSLQKYSSDNKAPSVNGKKHEPMSSLAGIAE